MLGGLEEEGGSQNQRAGIGGWGGWCMDHVGLFGWCNLVFSLNEMGSYCEFLSRGVS